MKFYSEVLNKMFDNAEALKAEEDKAIKAKADKEAAEKAKVEQRAARAKAVEVAQKAAIEANQKYKEVLRDFCKDYGYYHNSIKSNDIDGLVDNLFASFTKW